MKILMFSDYFYPHIGGGVEQAVLEVSRRLVRIGHEVHVITMNTDHAAWCEDIDGIIVHRSRSVELTPLLRMQVGLSPDAFRLARRVADDVRPDLIHAHNLFFFMALPAVSLKRALRRPLVTTMQLGAMDRLGGLSQFVTTGYEATVGRLLLRASDRVIAVSQAVANHAMRLGAQANQVGVIPNGVDLARFTTTATYQANGRPRIALVGRLIFNKGPQFLVKAAPRILARHPDVEFIVAGDGPLRANLEAAVAELGLADAFTFLGLCSDVPAILRQATMLVRPSLSEGLPLTVLEAMACGLPVVATPVGGTAEVVRHGETGLLVEPGNSDQLADAVIHLLDAPAEARVLGMHGRALVEHRYGWERIVEQTLAVYGEVTGLPTTLPAARLKEA